MEKNGSEDDSTRMTLGEHLEELRKRLFWALLGLGLAMCITLPCGKYIIEDVLKRPYTRIMGEFGLEADLTVLTMVGGITVYIRVALVSGLVLASPWVFYQLWQFIAAGLYTKEKRYVHYAVPCSAGLFLIGAVFFLTVVSDQMFRFFIWFNTVYMNVKMVITLDKYITLVCLMMLVFGVAFQTPLAVLLLSKMGLVSTRTLNRYRKHVIVGMLILAALVTSPSPVDQVLLAVPMWLLYELGVLLAYLLVERKHEEVE